MIQWTMDKGHPMQDPSQSAWVINVGDADFETEVLERSRQVPVVVDFWAEWCGPCRMLGPILEKFAREKAGQFVLAKVNVDEAQQLAAYFGIEGIPAVRVFREGRLADGFEGLYPEPELRAFLDRHLPSESDRLVQKAAELETSNPVEAELIYRKALAANADDPQARVGLARVLLAAHKDDEAKQLLAPLGSVDEVGTEAERLRRILELRSGQQEGGSPSEAELRRKMQADPENARLRFELGSLLAQQERYPEALAMLLSAAERDRELGRTEVRELMVKIFEILGVRSELSDSYRDRLRSLLY
jgi:putative thioredoxin